MISSRLHFRSSLRLLFQAVIVFVVAITLNGNCNAVITRGVVNAFVVTPTTSIESFTTDRSMAKTPLPFTCHRQAFPSNRRTNSVARFAEEESSVSGGEKKDLYDDEVKERPPALSNSMRERLLKEASSGLDADQKQTNVLLYIMLGVAVLVLLGGQGILY